MPADPAQRALPRRWRTLQHCIRSVTMFSKVNDRVHPVPAFPHQGPRKSHRHGPRDRRCDVVRDTLLYLAHEVVDPSPLHS